MTLDDVFKRLRGLFEVQRYPTMLEY
jgi:hypothetical protein